MRRRKISPNRLQAITKKARRVGLFEVESSAKKVMQNISYSNSSKMVSQLLLFQTIFCAVVNIGYIELYCVQYTKAVHLPPPSPVLQEFVLDDCKLRSCMVMVITPHQGDSLQRVIYILRFSGLPYFTRFVVPFASLAVEECQRCVSAKTFQ